MKNKKIQWKSRFLFLFIAGAITVGPLAPLQILADDNNNIEIEKAVILETSSKAITHETVATVSKIMPAEEKTPFSDSEKTEPANTAVSENPSVGSGVSSGG